MKIAFLGPWKARVPDRVQSGAISRGVGRFEPVLWRGLIEFEASKSQLSKTIPRWLSYTPCNRSTPSSDRVTSIVSFGYQSANHRVLSFYSPSLPSLLRPCPQKFHSRNLIFPPGSEQILPYFREKERRRNEPGKKRDLLDFKEFAD